MADAVLGRLDETAVDLMVPRRTSKRRHQVDATFSGDRVGLSGVNAEITSKLTSFLSARSVRPAVLVLKRRRPAEVNRDEVLRLLEDVEGCSPRCSGREPSYLAANHRHQVRSPHPPGGNARSSPPRRRKFQQRIDMDEPPGRCPGEFEPKGDPPLNTEQQRAGSVNGPPTAHPAGQARCAE
jgi:hypothetical protein